MISSENAGFAGAGSGSLAPHSQKLPPSHVREREENEHDRTPSPQKRDPARELNRTESAELHPEVAQLPIAEHGIIGNMHTSALVGVDGNIDFLCFPHFDSPSVFASMLDAQRGGFFKVSPSTERPRCKQFYWPDTNILVSRFFTEHGVAQIVDFMPVKGTVTPWRNCVIRIVEGVRGDLKMKMECFPAFDCARRRHIVTKHHNGAIIFSGKDLKLALIAKGDRCGAVEMNIEGPGVTCEFTAKESYRIAFEIRVIVEESELIDATNFGIGSLSPQPGKTAAPVIHTCPTYDKIFHSNVIYWKQWLSQCTYNGHWKEMVHRSALVLKLLTFQETGAIISSPTFGLAHTQRGERNFDNRYSYIRDASFVLYALLRIGFRGEAEAYVRFLGARARQIQITYKSATSNEISPLLPVYTIEGEPPREERTLHHFRGSGCEPKPIVIGNNAHKYLQLDIFGELMDALYLFNKWGRALSYDGWQYLLELCDWVCDNWQRPDYSIWGIKEAGPRHNVYSKIMCWVAIDRALRLSDRRSFPLLTREEAERDEIEKGICGALHQSLESADSSISATPPEPETPNSEILSPSGLAPREAARALQAYYEKRDRKQGRRERWYRIRDEIYLDIMRRGWNPAVGAFVQAYGSNIIDSSLMTMPLVFFLAPKDPRMMKTIDRINSPVRSGGLTTGGLVKRFGLCVPEQPVSQPQSQAQQSQANTNFPLTGAPLSRRSSVTLEKEPVDSAFPEQSNPEFESAAEEAHDDKVPQDTGTFNMCTFWLIESLARGGGDRAEQARLLFEQMLTFGNHLGLFSAETSHTGQLMGNFPQALTHVTLISAAFNLSRKTGPRTVDDA